MSELPRGWQLARLDELCEWGSGGTPRRSEPSYFGGKFPWITISDLNDGVITSTTESLTEAGIMNSAAKLVPEDTVLVALYGSIGKLGITRQPSTTNQAIACALPDEKAFDPLYLFYYLRSMRRELSLLGTGVTQKNIYLGDIKPFIVPIAPRAEQTRIVAKLEELLSDLDAGVAELKAAQKKLQQYRQSLLKAAVEGELTASWRKGQRKRGIPTETGAQLLARILTERRARWEAKQLAKFKEQGKTPPKDWQKKYPEPVQPDITDLPTLPEGWAWASLDQLLSQLRSGSAETSKRDPTEYPVLKSSAVRPSSIDFTALNYLSAEQSQQDNYLEEGDLLITRLSGSVEYVGCCALVPSISAMSIQYPDRIFCGKLVLPSDGLAIHVTHVFRSPLARARIEAAAKSTAGHRRISLSDLHPFPIPLPPPAEMSALVEKVEAGLGSSEQMDAALRQASGHSVAQRQNILRSAFAGQLVPQDPTDEPASVLLERIRLERAERAKQPKFRKIKPTKEAIAVLNKLIDVLAVEDGWITAQEAFRRCGVADGAQTDQIEAIYAELRVLDKAGRLLIETVFDEQGRKLHDKLKLVVS